MLSSLRMALAIPLAGVLIFPFLDFVYRAGASGANADTYAVVARPLAFAVAAGLLAAVLGVAAGWALARFTSIPRRAAILGWGFAGPATVAAIFLFFVEPLPTFATPLRQLLVWSAVGLLIAFLFTMSAIGLETRERVLARTERILAAAPTVLVGGILFFVLGVLAPGWRWPALLTALALAVWLGLRPHKAFAWNALLAAFAVSLPWIGPAEPDLKPGPGLVGASNDLKPPRVILITVDTLRADELGFLGGKAVATPAFDALAADSVIFERAYSTSGWTLPALSSLHLGVSPWVHGAWAQSDRPSDTPRSLAERFAEAGYRTVKIGYNLFLTEAMTGPALSQGFQTTADYPAFVRPRTAAFEFLDARSLVNLEEEADTDDLFDWANEWVGANGDDPFFLWLHVFDPHQPYLPPAEFAPGGVKPAWNDPATNPEARPKSTEEAESMHGLYRAEIAYVDDRLGRFIGRLKELGLYEDSLIALVSDHGEEFFEHAGFGHGHTLYDELLHVPLALKLPQAAQKKRIAERVSTLSLAPTLLGLVNVAYDPADFSAEALPLEDGAPASPLFAAGNHHSESREAVIFDGLKLVRHLGFGAEQLFDLAADPGEQFNLATQRPDDVRRGVELLQQRREKALALRERLGVTDTAPIEYGPAEKRLLRSLGYIQ